MAINKQKLKDIVRVTIEPDGYGFIVVKVYEDEETTIDEDHGYRWFSLRSMADFKRILGPICRDEGVALT